MTRVPQVASAFRRRLAFAALWTLAPTHCSLLIAQTAPTQPATKPVPAERNAAEAMDGYYLRTCAVCTGLLGARGEAIGLRHQGRSLRVCCKDCRESFEHDPDIFLAKADAVMIADQLPYYPLRTSLIDNRALGAQPLDFIWGNRLFRAVDAADREQILADPAAAICRLDRAVIVAQTPTYGMPEKCPVQGDILPTDRKVDVVVANRMVRVCCGRCARLVRARPYQYLGMIEYANREAARQQINREQDRP